ncbi:unnamed protein product [Arctogadus glacialis]
MDAAARRGNRIIFTGPDGVGDYMSRRLDPRYVGSGTPSQEASGGLEYLTRAPPPAPGVPGVWGVPRSTPPPCVGAVGWGWSYSQQLNSTALLSNMQIKKSEMRTGEEIQTRPEGLPVYASLPVGCWERITRH